MAYEVVTAKKMRELVDKVNQMIGEGWEPQGGVAVEMELAYFAQGMVKRQVKS